MNLPLLYVVIPCFNEQECLKKTTRKVSQKLKSLISKKKIDPKSTIVYVDDGSKDNTWKIISTTKNVIGIKLSHNCGHQNALLAGLMYAKDHCDIAISMDADLQDDINAFDKMLRYFSLGCEIVYGVRDNRKSDSFFKRNTASLFYKAMNHLGVELIYNSADFRLMSKKALDSLSKFKETNLFLRGIVPLLGYKTATVSYTRSKRIAGQSKYPLSKMLRLATDGITSFSIRPIRLIFSLGLFAFCISLLFVAYAIFQKVANNAVPGWAFIVCSIWFLGGLQMLAIGLIGEYVGKIYFETKLRPRYIIEEIKQ